MMYDIKTTTRFKKDLRIAIKRGYNIDLLNDIVTKLANGKNYRKLIKIMCCPGNFLAAENVIYNPIGC